MTTDTYLSMYQNTPRVFVVDGIMNTDSAPKESWDRFSLLGLLYITFQETRQIIPRIIYSFVHVKSMTGLTQD